MDPSPLVLKRGEVNFDYLPRREESEKLQKRRWKYGAEADSLKSVCVCVCERGERWGTDTFRIYFFQGLSFLHIEIILPFAKLCYAFEEKLFFSVTIVL